MPVYIIVLIVVAALFLFAVLAALHPLRLHVTGSVSDKINAKIILKPFGIIPIKMKIVNIEDKPFGDKSEKEKECDKKENDSKEKRKKNKDKDKKTKLSFSKDDIVLLVDKVLKSLQIEKLDLEANLSGDPYRSGIACGILWTLFGGGFAYISHRVKKFTNKPVMNFGVDLERPWSAYGEIQIMIRFGDLVKTATFFLIVLIKSRKKDKEIKKEIKQEIEQNTNII